MSQAETPTGVGGAMGSSAARIWTFDEGPSVLGFGVLLLALSRSVFEA